MKFNLESLKKDFMALFNETKKMAEKHAPEILAGTGIGLFVTSGIKAVAVTPKATRIIDAKEQREKRVLSTGEVIKETYKLYLPSVVGTIGGAACVVLSVKTSNRRYLVLSSAYQFADETLKSYKEEIKNVVGAKKQAEIEANVSQKRIADKPVSTSEVIVTGKGKSLCYDSVSGRYFEFDLGDIKSVENQINYEIMHYNYVSLNDLYDYFGIEHIDLGYELGWNIDMVPSKDLLKITKRSIFTPDDQFCAVLEYNVEPKSKYDMFC